MIINGASRSGGAWFAKHLMNAQTNESVTLVEITGFRPSVTDLPTAFHEMEAIADNRGGMVKNYFYQTNINPEGDEKLTEEQWEQAADSLGRNLRLADQPRIRIRHVKDGREHEHIIFFRIDIDTGKAISDSLTASIHEQTSRELETAFGLKAGKSVLVPGSQHRHDKDKPKSWERFRGMESGVDPRELAGRLTALWQAADSGKSFAAAIEAEGFMLAKGDKPGVLLVIDQAGQEHSLVRRLKGVTTKEMQARMADIDREALPDAATARAAQRGRIAAEPVTVPPQSEIRPEIRAVERPASDPPPQPVRATEKAPVARIAQRLPSPVGYGTAGRRGRVTRYRRRQTSTGPRFRIPTWRPAPERAAKDPSLIPTRPPAPNRAPEEPDLPSMAGTGRKHQAVNTLAPTPVQIPEDPAERAAYFGAVSGKPDAQDLKAARDRAKAGREQERRLKAAGRINSRVQTPSLPAQLKAMARGILRKLTGRDIDTRLLTDEQRTQLAADKAEQEAGKIAAWRDPRPRRIAALMDWRGRTLRLRIATGRLTGRHMDTRLMTQAQRDLIRQMNAALGESIRHLNEGNREARRVERARLRPLRKFTPD